MVASPLNVVVVASAVALTGLFVGGILRGGPARGSDAGVRRVVAGVVVGWAALVFLLGARGAFAAHADRFDPWVVLGIVVPVLLGVLLFSTVPSLRRLAGTLPTPWLIGLQIYRVVGFTFVVAAWQGRIPFEFALPAGLGDFAIGVLAPLVALSLARGRRGSHALAVAWNLAGIADLVVAVTLGVLTSPTTIQVLALGHANAEVTRFPFVLIPAFAVPASLLLHVLTLWRLGASRRGRLGTQRAQARAGFLTSARRQS
jgi:hypothetical protein